MQAETQDENNSSTQQLPELPDDGLLIKTLYVGICHVTGNTSSEETPRVAGHEVCGKVLNVGAKVPDDCPVRVGDVIIVYPYGGCGQCEICSASCPHLCEEQKQVLSPRTDHKPPHSTSFDSFQVVSDWQRAIRLPREISPEFGCLLPCSALRAYTTLLDARPCFDQAVRIRGFANLLIVGGHNVDGLELWCVQLMRNVFCDRFVKIVCASRHPERLDLAIKAGADDAVLLPTDSTISQLVEATTMSGYNRMDVSIDLVGDAESFLVALRSLHQGGTLIELGAWDGDDCDTASAAVGLGDTQLSLTELVSRSVTLRAIKTGSLAQLSQLVDLLAIQQVHVDIDVKYYRPDELSTAVDRLRRHLATGHAVIKYE